MRCLEKRLEGARRDSQAVESDDRVTGILLLFQGCAPGKYTLEDAAAAAKQFRGQGLINASDLGEKDGWNVLDGVKRR